MKTILTVLPEDAICFCMYPSVDMKEEYMQKYRDRRSPKEFIEIMDKNWEKFINSVEKYDIDYRVMMIEIRPESKNIKTVYDLIKINPGCPIEEV